MPEQVEPQFEHAALEKEIKRLSAELKSQKGKEALRDVLRNKIVPTGEEGTVPTSQPAKPPTTSVTLPHYLDKETDMVKLKVEKLLDLALHKGIKRAAVEARDGGPLIMDAFHDALTDRLYKELKQRGLL